MGQELYRGLLFMGKFFGRWGFRQGWIALALVGIVGAASLLALQPTAARAAARTSTNKVFNYTGQVSGQIVDDTYLGSDSQGYELHQLTITTNLSPQQGAPALTVHFDVSEGFVPLFANTQKPDVLPNGGTVAVQALLSGTASVTNPAGTISVYRANVSGLVLPDNSIHFDVEGIGVGQASGGKTSLYLNLASSPDSVTLSGQVSGSLDIPQQALDLLTSTDPLIGPTIWYLMRASGLAALTMLALVVMIGLALRVRLWKERLERWRVYDVHLTVSVLLGVFLAVHLVVVFLDRIVPFSLADMLIPLHDAYQPLWIGAGIVAFYLLLVVWGSSLIRSRLGYSLWRKIHPVALVALGLVVLHALYAGTDGARDWLMWSLVVAGIVVVWLCERWWRLKSAAPPPRRRHQQRPGGAAPSRQPTRRPQVQRPGKALSK
jgi:sulfoxide reductase heme-binding subunit YedZ